jgi:cytochrome c peroxidase
MLLLCFTAACDKANSTSGRDDGGVRPPGVGLIDATLTDAERHVDGAVLLNDAGMDASSQAVEGGVDGGNAYAFDWSLPPGFPVPAVPVGNPMTREKVELGRYLFYDTRLSGNETQACAGCHIQSLAFTDGRPHALGSTGLEHPRNAMSIANVAYNATLTWGHPFMYELERQAIVPMFGADPVELGLASNDQLESRLAEVPLYQTLFSTAFPDETNPITVGNVTKALASFQRTIISGRSPFDRYQYLGDEGAVSEAARRGYQLFNSEKFECFHCHSGFNLMDQTYWQDKAFFVTPFHNTGLYNIDGQGAYPAPNTGIHNVTGKPEDMGKFRAQSLRNIAVTAPYMHDGSIATLDEVLDHYAAGGRTIHTGPNAGNGSQSPLQDPLIRPIAMTPEERADLMAYFESLTDEELLTDPAFSNPWQ